MKDKLSTLNKKIAIGLLGFSLSWAGCDTIQERCEKRNPNEYKKIIENSGVDCYKLNPDWKEELVSYTGVVRGGHYEENDLSTRINPYPPKFYFSIEEKEGNLKTFVLEYEDAMIGDSLINKGDKIEINDVWKKSDTISLDQIILNGKEVPDFKN